MSFSQVSNLATNERTDDKYYKKMHLDETEMPPQSFLTDIASGLRRAMKLNLFNFDVIRDARFGNRYLIIDINYFPGYAKMPGYETVLTNFFCDIMEKKEREAGKDSEEKDGGDSRGCDKEMRKVVSNTCCSDGEDGVLPVSPLSREEEKPIQV